MSTDVLDTFTSQDYKYGFYTDIEADSVPPGLNEETIAFISKKKGEPEWMLEYRLKAYQRWCQMKEPHWAFVQYPAINYQDIVYYSAPKKTEGPKSLDEVDPEILKTYEKLGIPLHEQKALAGVAVDAVFDSVSVVTTFKKQLEEVGVIFCSMSEAIQHHPELVKKYLFQRPTISSRRSIQPYLPMGRFVTCPRVSDVRLSCRPTSGSMRPRPANSKEP
jgi:Fe-S cluster assembly protein SufB